MAVYQVYVHFEGCIPFEVKAENEDEACLEAETCFNELTYEEVYNEIAGTVYDVQELK